MICPVVRKYREEYANKGSKMKNKDVGFLRKSLLKLITKLQVMCMKSDEYHKFGDIYLLLSKAHFFLYFGESLVNSAVEGNANYKKFLDRHVAMFMSIVYPSLNRSSFFNEKQTVKLVKKAITSNLILRATL